jgi:predicted DNA-binding transcriptional regulator AlpA
VANQTAQVEATRSGGSFSIAQWCQHHGLSGSYFYKLQKAGRAPVTINIGRRRLVSSKADQDWVRANEHASAA